LIELLINRRVDILRRCHRSTDADIASLGGVILTACRGRQGPAARRCATWTAQGLASIRCRRGDRRFLTHRGPGAFGASIAPATAAVA
jgi:hypothetical protein